ncbi:MAG TPA: hypothetical protein VNW97_02485 [Candidatus Saccharimonadales bacterium]|jgi:hypothetical protein|nr:hypothetical protein [Candidatus Saccharimonadales bacterium]
MRCEQFLFEAAYLPESADSEGLGLDLGLGLGREALEHMRVCDSCHAQLRRLRHGFHSIESESLALMGQRLHRELDQVIAEKSAQLERRASFGKMWAQVALASLILVASIAGISYQSHPTVQPPIYARR